MIPVLADIKRQLEEDIEALHEYEKTIKDEERASNEEIRKLLQDRAKVVAQRREKNNESDSESDSE
jgi:hypothetical protein